MSGKPDFKSTMNLPRTEFPMKAGLAQREPEWLAFWDEIDVYRRSLEANRAGPVFILHDGPPYANGHIHMGTAFNKVLKDLVVKYKSMRGYFAPYVPGWDCHGQPIEHQVEKELGPERMRTISQAELRARCREYAMRFVGVQAEEFKRLGVRGEFDHPYLTLDPSYEAGNVRIFKEMYRKGMVYKGRKPIHWCVRCQTALAEAEIEYADETSNSIYVRFEFTSRPPGLASLDGPVGILVWTTTPWTLPANAAVAVSEGAEYVALRTDCGAWALVAGELADRVAEVAGWTGERADVVVAGSDLVGFRYAHPVHDGLEGVVVAGAHVDLTTGTGAVHTAPGHGEEDYLVGLEHGLPAPMPVDSHGVFDAGGGPFQGKSVWDANPEIVAYLRDRGTLAAAGQISHSYPHCWRCKRPVIFRATEQWFVAMDRAADGVPALREEALRAIGEVRWIPGWSVNRISAMVGDRPDWCISRQRAWGVPIPVFRCAVCGETVADDRTFDAVIALFETEGADAWFTKAPAEYLPAGTSCGGCGSSEILPEDDIVDVWFESGVSHTSVLEAREGLHRPCELYLEGSDQHRGWFQSALLTSVGAYGAAPYEAVLTHGFIVDGEGRKMSKSLGNVISPLDVVAKSGADIIRLWVASADYSQDVNVSDEILDRTSEAYRRIRNTFRFLLSNLYDFEPDMAVAWADMPEIDRFALVRLSDVVRKATTAYDEWRFHAVHHTVFNYCVTDLSAFYLDVLKDRLYSDAAGSPSRRSAQTVVATVLADLARLLAPVLTFTTEEVWQSVPEALRGGAPSVQLAGWPDLGDPPGSSPAEADELRSAYAVVLEVRESVTRALEEARAAGRIGKSQEAAIRIDAPADVEAVLRQRGEGPLADMLIVSSVKIAASGGDQLAVTVETAEGEKCPRCWNHRDLSGADVCPRCLAVLGESGD